MSCPYQMGDSILLTRAGQSKLEINADVQVKSLLADSITVNGVSLEHYLNALVKKLISNTNTKDTKKPDNTTKPGNTKNRLFLPFAIVYI